GSLAYQPRPLELPETLPAAGKSVGRFQAQRSWLIAAAAAVVLMLLAGLTFVALRQRMVTPTEMVKQPSPPAPQATPRQETAGVTPSPEPVREIVKDEGASRPKRQVVAGRPKRGTGARRGDVARGGAARQTRVREFTAAELKAKEQLMLGLRFASAGLRYAQEHVREAGRGEVAN
ncbi:MAG: hypothetical protein ACRD9R_22570, partial [Pyrinomonadaceae bacterium]